jgi:hypothetical protein
MEDQGRLVVDHGWSVYDDRWLVIDDWWTSDEQGGAVNHDLGAMIDFGRWVIYYWWTIYYNVFLLLLRHLQNICESDLMNVGNQIKYSRLSKYFD